MSLLKPVISFASGLLSPWIDSRFDIAKYDGGCRLLENFIVLPQGAAQKRPGMERLARATTGATTGFLLPFQISTTEAVMLILGGGKMQVRSTGIPSAAVIEPMDIPWADAQLRQLRFRQINSVIFFTHPEVPQQKLTRFAADDYTLAPVDYSKKPPLLAENLVQEHKITIALDVPGLSAWSGDSVRYTAGQKVTHAGQTWKAQKTHTSSSTKPPGAANSTYPATVFTSGGLVSSYQVQKPLWIADFVDQSVPVGAEVNLSATIDTWQAGHVGAVFEIAKERQPTAYEVKLALTTTAVSPQYSPTLVVQGGWTILTDGNWNGTWTVQKSDDQGQTWRDLRSWQGTGDRNIDSEGTEDARVLMRVAWAKSTTANGSGVGGDGASVLLSATDSKIRGLVRILTVIDAKNATAEVITPVESGTTSSWSEGAWSDVQGYPRAIELHQGRVVMAGSTLKPHTIWGSAVDDYENFYRGTDADMSFAHTVVVAERDPILWLISDRALLVGTGAAEFTVWGEDQDKQITPEAGNSRRQSSFGSHNGGMPAIYTDSVTLFVQRGGTVVREYAYGYEADRFEAANLNILADHLFEQPIESVAFQRLPWQIVWIVSGGKLFGLTYEKKQEVAAWHRHTTDGTILNVAVIRGDDREDEVWLLVQRDENLGIERFRPGHMASRPDDGWWSDGAVGMTPDYDFSDTVHLIDREVVGYSEGVFAGKAVLGGNEIVIGDDEIVIGDQLIGLGGGSWPFAQFLILDISEKDPEDDLYFGIGGTFHLQGLRNGKQWFAKHFNETTHYAQWTTEGKFVVFIGGTLVLESTEDVERIQDVENWTVVAAGEYQLGEPLWEDPAIPAIDVADLRTNSVTTPSLVGLQIPFEEMGVGDKPYFLLPADGDTDSVSIIFLGDGWYINHGPATWKAAGNARAPWLAGTFTPLFGCTGNVTLEPIPKAGNFNLVLGLPYTADLQPMKPEVALQNGPSRSREWRWHRVSLSLRDSRGGQLGETPESNFDPLQYDPLKAPPGLPFTGEIEHDFAGGYSEEGNVCVRSDEPYPFALRAMILKGNVYGDR